MKIETVKKQVMSHYSELKSGKSLEERYPELEMNDEKKHILFVQCLLERTSFYRTYLPYLILNDSDTHTAIIASIQKRDFNKSFEDYDVFLQVDLIQWADVIVFPVLLFDCKKMYSSILKINPNLKFMMDIDDVYVNERDEVEPQLIENLRFNHIISCSSSNLVKIYKEAFSEQYNIAQKAFLSLPTFLVSTYMSQRSDDPIENGNSIRIGLQQGNFTQSTLNSISEVAKSLNKLVTLCIYGNNKEQFEFPDNLKVQVFKAVKFLDYIPTVKEMNLDFAVLEGKNELIEPQRAIFQYGELALLSIPLITDDKNRGRRFVKHTINGFILSQNNSLKKQLETLFADISLAHKAGKAAQGMALKHLSWNAKRASQLISIYK
ncbi:MAG: hypothetical protein RJQ00_06050 [Vicingaceae bacterium]